MMKRKLKLGGMLMALASVCAATASLASATFTSEKYPAAGSGGTTADVIDAFGSTIKCTHNTFQIDMISKATETLTVTPSYNGCTAFGLPMTVNLTGCDVVAHNGSGKATVAVDVVCPPGITGIDATIFSGVNHAMAYCHLVLHPFTEKEGLTASNSGGNVVVKGTLENLKMTQARTNVVICPPGTETATAKYTVQEGGATIKGSNGAISLS